MANADSKSRPLNEESRTITEYREWWLNHAMLTGGSAVDGCGEFTPKGDQEKNASGFHPLSSSLPLTSPPPPCYLRTSVSDQESLFYVPPPPPPPPRKSEKKTKARKGPKRGTLMHNRK
ncbi:hypothetical protein Peur_027729 [Populus x canadensis]